MILEFKCVPHFFLLFLIFKPFYVPEATGGGLASSLFVYCSHPLKYIVLKILMRRGSQKSTPFHFCFFVQLMLLCFLKRACCEGGGYREREGGIRHGGVGQGDLRVCLLSFSVWCFVQS